MTLLRVLSPLRLYPPGDCCKDFLRDRPFDWFDKLTAGKLRDCVKLRIQGQSEIVPYFRQYFSMARSVAILRKSFSWTMVAVFRSFL